MINVVFSNVSDERMVMYHVRYARMLLDDRYAPKSTNAKSIKHSTCTTKRKEYGRELSSAHSMMNANQEMMPGVAGSLGGARLPSMRRLASCISSAVMFSAFFGISGSY
jgi:hypothetical protein